MVELIGLEHEVNAVRDAVVVRDDVHQGQRVAVLVGVDRLVDVQVARRLFQPAEVHEDFIFDAARGIGGKTRPLLVVEGGDGLDQSDGADRNQVVLIL